MSDHRCLWFLRHPGDSSRCVPGPQFRSFCLSVGCCGSLSCRRKGSPACAQLLFTYIYIYIYHIYPRLSIYISIYLSESSYIYLSNYSYLYLSIYLSFLYVACKNHTHIILAVRTYNLEGSGFVAHLERERSTRRAGVCGPCE